MFPIPAPTASCDFSKGNEPDNAPNKNELKLVSISDLKAAHFKDTPRDTRISAQAETFVNIPANVTPPYMSSETDPSSLAARILQMHAGSGDLQQRPSRKPQLVGVCEDSAFDMPGVLLRPAPGLRSKGLQPDPVPVPDPATRASLRLRSGPSFGALVASTLLIVAVGSGAALFGLTDLLTGRPEDGRAVTTQRIEAEPTIASLIEDSEPGTLGRSNMADAPEASPEQVINAKDRIRQAFSARSLPSAAPIDLARPLSNTVAVDETKDQARLASPQPQPGAAQAAASPYVPQHPRVDVRTSALEGIGAGASGRSRLGPGTELRPAGEPAPAPAEDIRQAERQTSAAPAAPEDQIAAAGPTEYPNAGRITTSVNLRQAKDKDAPVLAVIPAGTEVRFGDCGTWWCAVALGEKQGFVGQKFVESVQ